MIERIENGWRFHRGFQFDGKLIDGMDVSLLAIQSRNLFTANPECEYIDYVEPVIEPVAAAIPSTEQDQSWLHRESTQHLKKVIDKAVDNTRSQRRKAQVSGIKAERKAADQFRRFKRLQETGSDFRCDRCGIWHAFKRLRVLFREQVPIGHYCTDCFYNDIDGHLRSERLQHGRRHYASPQLEEQESIEHADLVVRCNEHRDLRWEFHFLGKNTGKYRKPSWFGFSQLNSVMSWI